MPHKILKFAIMTCLPVLSACSTLPPTAGLDIPTPPLNPPDAAMALCPTHLQALPINRAVEQSEGWQTMISWAEDYHACKTKHAYLAGWVAAQVNASKPLQEPKKRTWFGF